MRNAAWWTSPLNNFRASLCTNLQPSKREMEKVRNLMNDQKRSNANDKSFSLIFSSMLLGLVIHFKHESEMVFEI